VWSMISGQDACAFDAKAKAWNCEVSNRFESIDNVAEYCAWLWQGNRQPWRVPTYAEFVEAFGAGYIPSWAETVVNLGDIQIELPSGQIHDGSAKMKMVAFCVAE
jgi:hypothetical protein